MNDRFRFRAWNKEDNKMYEAEGVYAYKDESTNGGEVFLKGVKTSYYFPEQVELMQCTGLKDKNGQLIYEGDIVKINNVSLGKVVFRTCAFFVQFSKDKYHAGGIGAYEERELEVIGNIYENKELLEVK